MKSPSKPVAGTYVLSGILQGKVLLNPDFLEIWSKEVSKNGLPFSLRIDANDFSLLPTETAQSSNKLGGEPLEDLVSSSIESLIKLFDEPAEAQIFSTLRSEEFRFGKSQQTLYKLQNDGSVASESRVVEADTEEAPLELTAKGKLKLLLISLGVLAAMILITIPFVNYGEMFADAKDKVTSLKADELEVDTKNLNQAISVSVKEIILKENIIVLKVEKGERWGELYNSNPNSQFKTWKDFHIASSLHDRLRCEWYDKHGKLLLISYMQLDELKSKDSLEKKILVKTKGKVASVKLLPN